MNDENRLSWQRKLFGVADSLIISTLRLDASADLNPLGTKLIICFAIPLALVLIYFRRGGGGAISLYK